MAKKKCCGKWKKKGNYCKNCPLLALQENDKNREKSKKKKEKNKKGKKKD